MAVDIGNTQTVLGLFDGEEPRGQWRVATEAHRTADELAVVYAALLQMRGLRRGGVAGARGPRRPPPAAHGAAGARRGVYAALLQMRGLRLGDVDAMIVSSVVPALARSYTDLASQFFGVPFYRATAGLE